MKFFAQIFSTVFGIGYVPLAPGTVASVLAIFLYKFSLCKWSWPPYLGLLVLLFFMGAFASSRYAKATKKEDPRSVVIDETLGQLIVLFRLPPSWLPLCAGFVLFRAFDILKPFVIKKAENFPRGWGIMMDDVVSGLCAGIIINLVMILK